MKNRIAHLGKNAWNRGVPRTEEVKQKLRKPHYSTRGKNCPAKRLDVRQKISKANLGQNNGHADYWKILDTETNTIIEIFGGLVRWCKDHNTTSTIVRKGLRRYQILEKMPIRELHL